MPVRQHRLSYGSHPAQWIEIYRPDATWHRAPTAVVVVIHGGFWRARYDAELGVPLCLDLARRGYVAVNLEYRRVGDGGGWPSTFLDVAAGIDRLADLPEFGSQRVITLGHSAGGQLAVWAAARDRLPLSAPGSSPRATVNAAVSQAGVLCLAAGAEDRLGAGAVLDFMGGTPASHPDRYASTDPMVRLPLNALIRAIHAQDDDDVPFDYSARYVAAARSAGVDAALIEVSGGHMGLIDPASAAWAATVAVLEDLSSAPSPTQSSTRSSKPSPRQSPTSSSKLSSPGDVQGRQR